MNVNILTQKENALSTISHATLRVNLCWVLVATNSIADMNLIRGFVEQTQMLYLLMVFQKMIIFYRFGHAGIFADGMIRVKEHRDGWNTPLLTLGLITQNGAEPYSQGQKKQCFYRSELSDHDCSTVFFCSSQTLDWVELMRKIRTAKCTCRFIVHDRPCSCAWFLFLFSLAAV